MDSKAQQASSWGKKKSDATEQLTLSLIVLGSHLKETITYQVLV